MVGILTASKFGQPQPCYTFCKLFSIDETQTNNNYRCTCKVKYLIVIFKTIVDASK